MKVTARALAGMLALLALCFLGKTLLDAFNGVLHYSTPQVFIIVGLGALGLLILGTYALGLDTEDVSAAQRAQIAKHDDRFGVPQDSGLTDLYPTETRGFRNTIMAVSALLVAGTVLGAYSLSGVEFTMRSVGLGFLLAFFLGVAHEGLHWLALNPSQRKTAHLAIDPRLFNCAVLFRGSMSKRHFIAMSLTPLLVLSVVPAVLIALGVLSSPLVCAYVAGHTGMCVSDIENVMRTLRRVKSDATLELYGVNVMIRQPRG